MKLSKWTIFMLLVVLAVTIMPQDKQAASCSILTITKGPSDYESSVDIIGSQCTISIIGLNTNQAVTAIKEKADQVGADEVVTLGGTITFPPETNTAIAQAVNRNVTHLGGQDVAGTKDMLQAYVNGESIEEVTDLQGGEKDYPIFRISCPYEANNGGYCYEIYNATPHYNGHIVGAAQYRYTPPEIDWNLEMEVSPELLWIGQETMITAHVDHNVTKTPYYINIWEGDRLIKTCSSGSSCVAYDTRSSPGTNTYVATVSGYQTKEELEDTSNQKKVEYKAPDLFISNVMPAVPHKIHRGDMLSTRVHVDSNAVQYNFDAFDVELRVDGKTIKTKRMTGAGWIKFSYPFDYPEGDHNVEIVVDAKNDIQESNKDNNSHSYIVQAMNKSPNAGFEWTPKEPIEGEQVNVKSTSSEPDGDDFSHKWTIIDPDGTLNEIENEKEFQRIFDKPGDYKVELLVTDEYKKSDSISKTITVQPKNELNAQILHTKEWADKQQIPRDEPGFVVGESFDIEANTSDTATKVAVIPPEIIADKKKLDSNTDETRWETVVTPQNPHELKEGSYTFTVKATFEDEQVITRELTANIGGEVDTNIHLTQ